jgi:spermidine/putrescine transport system permease protein
MGAWLRRRRGVIPYLLLGPGLLWLVVFYVYPSFQMFVSSFWSGSIERGWDFSLSNWTTYPDSIGRFLPQLQRSVEYALAATILTFLIAYPLAYAIAFRAGRAKNLMLFLVVAPFFTSYLLRTISWKIMLSDSGPFLGPIKDAGLLPHDFQILSTSIAVVSGITYNFLPFMVLPLYVAIEKVDKRLVEAAQDLYAGPWRRGGAIAGGIGGGVLGLILGLIFEMNPTLPIAGAALGAATGALFLSESFIRVTFPLSLPGVFAGSLLTFIPAIGDYVNSELLGSTSTRMIGNVIQNRFLTQGDYPSAAALSFALMAAIVVAVAIYARALGTDELAAGRTF